MSPLHRPLRELRPHQSRHGTLRHVSRISRVSGCHREGICSLVPDAHPCEGMVRNHNSPSLTGQVGYAQEGGFMNTNDIVLAIEKRVMGRAPKHYRIFSYAGNRREAQPRTDEHAFAVQ
jgi:hypothetical protein